ncbi:MAG: hypothetical protein RMK94_12100 [Armatimonadota bacterium]|nr:hypothetical protein [Armatimonadota bacterium]
MEGNPKPTVTYIQLLSLLHVRLIYLSACRTCLDINGKGLVSSLANMTDIWGRKIGAKAVVSYHVPLSALGTSPSQKTDPVFWRKLAGKIVNLKLDPYGKIISVEIKPDPQGAGNVEQAATEAAKQLFTIKRWVT